MNKRFTLIKLLSIIAIIVITIIITSPIISSVLENFREKTFKNSVQELVNIIKMDYNEYGRKGEITYQFYGNNLKCVSCDDGNDLKLDYTGDLQNATGNIINNNGSITLSISNNEFLAAYTNNKVTVIKKQS